MRTDEQTTDPTPYSPPEQGGEGVAAVTAAVPEIKKFSTFEGVFLPTILTIFGLVIFMRATFVTGHAGIYQALGILIAAKSITTLTGLSISAIATNTEVKGGGVYYLISRSLGPEFGGAIALTIFISQSLSIPFYLIGFAEATVLTFPELDIYFDLIAYAIFAATAMLSLRGAGVVVKAQYVVMAILALAIAGFLAGAVIHFDLNTFVENARPLEGSPYTFWMLFAIYFPAVTGILSGVNMSGDLKNPARAIPRGTLLAIGVAFLVYAAEMVLCGGAIPRSELTERPYESILHLWDPVTAFIVVPGVMAATLSSALGIILGAPRVLQSLAQDKILKPVNIFAKVTPQGEPRRALFVTIAISFAVIYIACRGGSGGGALNMVASVVSMFFLWTYGIINLAAFVESFSRNPSFRPRFKFFHWFGALVGAVACFAATLLINPVAALLAGAFFAGIFFYVRKYVMSVSFGDARRGFIYSRTRDNLLTLSSLPAHPKNWRPTIVAFAGDPTSRLHLVKYADWLSSGRGILTIAAMVNGDMNEMADTRAGLVATFQEFLNKNRIRAFPEVLVTSAYNTGITHFLQVNSIGPIKPNLAIFGWSGDPAHAESFMESIRIASMLNMSVGLIHGRELPDPNPRNRRNRRVDIWWRGMRNGSLMVILAHLMSLNSEWTGAKIRILRVAYTPEEQAKAREELERLIEAARMDIEVEPIISDDTFPNLLRRYSGLSTAVFLGFSAGADTDPKKFQEAYTGLLHGMPTTIMIQSTGEADLLS
ncbi:MAG: amino acid permease [Chitinispirillales bacterium]|jgi:amino acid transporter|nr:amino acid permease [Chitinispirillales bacterium]